MRLLGLKEVGPIVSICCRMEEQRTFLLNKLSNLSHVRSGPVLVSYVKWVFFETFDEGKRASRCPGVRHPGSDDSLYYPRYDEGV